MHPRLHTRLCDLVGVEYPIVQTGMGWVAGRAPRRRPPPTPAALGILASATMDLRQLRRRDRRGEGAHAQPVRREPARRRRRHRRPVRLLIDEGVKVASFAQAPKEALISALHDGGVLVDPVDRRQAPRREGARVGRRRRARAGRRGRRPHRLGADLAPAAAGGRRGAGPRSRDRAPAGSSTAAASSPRSPTAPTASRWAPASCSPPTRRCRRR